MLRCIFLGVYVLGLILFISAVLVSRLSKRKLLSRVLSIVSTFLMTSWSICTLVLAVKTGVSSTFFGVLYAAVVILNTVFNSVLFILAILGELDLCSDSDNSNEDN